MEKYSAAVYWAMYTLTSVGYGDISATNTTEMQVCTICLLIGSFMWAYIIGSACSIAASISASLAASSSGRAVAEASKPRPTDSEGAFVMPSIIDERSDAASGYERV